MGQAYAQSWNNYKPSNPYPKVPHRGSHRHGCVKVESRVLRNPQARFGGRRLETQVKLCAGRLPYALLFADDKSALWAWREAIVERLARLRLTLHEGRAQAYPVSEGIPFLGFRVYPDQRGLKSARGYAFRRRLDDLVSQCRNGDLSTDRLTAAIQGWVAHAAHGDTWGLRRAVLCDVGV